MPVIKYNTKTKIKRPYIKPQIRISRKDSFTINQNALDVLGFNEGDRVGIVHYKNDDGFIKTSEFFLVHDPEGYVLKTRKHRSYLTFINNRLAGTILNALALFEQSYSFEVAKKPSILEDGTKGWCILTATAKR